MKKTSALFLMSIMTSLVCGARDMPISNGRLVNELNANQYSITNLPDSFWVGHEGMTTNAVENISANQITNSVLVGYLAQPSVTNRLGAVKRDKLDLAVYDGNKYIYCDMLGEGRYFNKAENPRLGFSSEYIHLRESSYGPSALGVCFTSDGRYKNYTVYTGETFFSDYYYGTDTAGATYDAHFPDYEESVMCFTIIQPSEPRETADRLATTNQLSSYTTYSVMSQYIVNVVGDVTNIVKSAAVTNAGAVVEAKAYADEQKRSKGDLDVYCAYRYAIGVVREYEDYATFIKVQTPMEGFVSEYKDKNSQYIGFCFTEDGRYSAYRRESYDPSTIYWSNYKDGVEKVGGVYEIYPPDDYHYTTTIYEVFTNTADRLATTNQLETVRTNVYTKSETDQHIATATADKITAVDATNLVTSVASKKQDKLTAGEGIEIAQMTNGNYRWSGIVKTNIYDVRDVLYTKEVPGEGSLISTDAFIDEDCTEEYYIDGILPHDKVVIQKLIGGDLGRLKSIGWGEYYGEVHGEQGVLVTNTVIASTISTNGFITAQTATNIAEDVNATTRAIVATWENFLDGSNVVFSITNYISGTYNLDTAKLRIMEMTNNVYREVYNSRDEILLHINDFKNTDFATATNQVIQGVSAAIAEKADKAWGKYTSAGGEAPSNTVYMTAPNTVFAGGMEYERVAVGEGSVCILTTKGAPTYTTGDEGTFKFQDDGGTNYFGFAKTDSYVIGADASGISVQNHIVTINYDVTMSGVPCIWYKQAIESDVEWEQLNLPDGTPVAGASHVVSWEATPPAGRETCYINCPEAKGFFKATIEVAGSAKFMTNMPADFSGGILCTDGEHKVKINWNNGAPTLVPAN